jgi:hypothetical protein
VHLLRSIERCRRGTLSVGFRVLTVVPRCGARQILLGCECHSQFWGLLAKGSRWVYNDGARVPHHGDVRTSAWRGRREAVRVRKVISGAVCGGTDHEVSSMSKQLPA